MRQVQEPATREDTARRLLPLGGGARRECCASDWKRSIGEREALRLLEVLLYGAGECVVWGHGWA